VSKACHLAPLLAVLLIASAHAGESYVGVGTTGFELGYALRLGTTTGLRADLDYLDYGRDFNSNGADYTARLKLANVGAYVDYFPAGRFRLTGGVLLGTRKVDGNGVTTGGTVTINGTPYPAPAGEGVSVSDKFPAAAPYLGFGFGHAQGRAGLGFYFDAGAAFGKGDVSLTATPGLVAAAGQDNIDAERARVQDELDRLKVYPVIKFGLTYTY